MLPLYDWSKTRAFALPTDQHGWIRINLLGRESQGIVPANCYEDLCAELEQRLRDLKSENGARLVSEIIRTADHVDDALNRRIPDLVIHWADAAFAAGSRIKGSRTEVAITGHKYTGQHALEGFCILAGPGNHCEHDVLAAKDMHLLINRILTASGPEESNFPA
jgi:predicted AlkP superfamily phosphohydrolase/phosphomutase